MRSCFSACPMANTSQNFNSPAASCILWRRQWRIPGRFIKEKLVSTLTKAAGHDRNIIFVNAVTATLHRWLNNVVEETLFAHFIFSPHLYLYYCCAWEQSSPQILGRTGQEVSRKWQCRLCQFDSVVTDKPNALEGCAASAGIVRAVRTTASMFTYVPS